MDESGIYRKLVDKSLSSADLASQALENSELIPALIQGMKEQAAAVKYGCQKALRKVVDKEPKLMLPYFDTFVDLLDHQKNIFQWQGLYMLAGMAGVDREGKIEGILEKYFARVTGPMMITAANAIKWSPKIVLAQPELADAVVGHILRSERGSYESDSCYEIVMGTEMKAFYKMRKWVQPPAIMLEFAKRHSDSEHPITQAASKKLLARLEKDFSLA